jgi:hypothetical protein
MHVIRQGFANPTVFALSVYIDYAGVAKLSFLVCLDAKAVRIAASSSGVPSDATTRAAGLTGLDAIGTVKDFTLMLCPAGGSVFAKIFAYENADGAGSESRIPVTLQVNLVSSSTSLNGQGSTLPSGVPAVSVTTRWGGSGAGKMWVAFTWSAFNVLRPDGSTMVVPGPPTALAAPTLSQVAGGTRGATTLFARVALRKDGHLYAVSTESSMTVSANNLLNITSPASVPGYDGWVALVGPTTNAELLQAYPNIPSIDLIPFGTDYTEPAAHFSLNTTPYDNTFWPGAIIYAHGPQNTLAYFYPYLDQFGTVTLRIAPQGETTYLTAPSAPDASIQCADGMIPLQIGNNTVNIGTTSGPGNSFGGRYT